MNHLKTFTLLAALTALFVGLGYLIGGPTGMLIALVFAGGMNLFSYWNADKIVLRMYRAQPVDETHPNAVVRTYVADVAQFTPKTVETTSEREKLMFRVKARINPDLLLKHKTKVKTGLPGVAYLRLDSSQPWPDVVPELVQ